VIDDYERIRIDENLSCYEMLEKSTKQNNILETHIKKLENDIKLADGYKIKVIIED
jgi:hypothetical protein